MHLLIWKIQKFFEKNTIFCCYLINDVFVILFLLLVVYVASLYR